MAASGGRGRPWPGPSSNSAPSRGTSGTCDGIWDHEGFQQRDPEGTGILAGHRQPPHLGNVHGEPPAGGPDEPLDALGPAQQQLGSLQVVAALGAQRGLRQLPPPQLQELQLLLGWEGGSGVSPLPSACPPRPQCPLYLFQWVWEPVGGSGGAVAAWEGAQGERWAAPGAVGWCWEQSLEMFHPGNAPHKLPGPPNPTLAALLFPSSSASSSSSSCSGPASFKAASSIPEMLGSDGISAPWMGGKPGKGGILVAVGASHPHCPPTMGQGARTNLGERAAPRDPRLCRRCEHGGQPGIAGGAQRGQGHQSGTGSTGARLGSSG